LYGAVAANSASEIAAIVIIHSFARALAGLARDCEGQTRKDRRPARMAGLQEQQASLASESLGSPPGLSDSRSDYFS